VEWGWRTNGRWEKGGKGLTKVMQNVGPGKRKRYYKNMNGSRKHYGKPAFGVRRQDAGAFGKWQRETSCKIESNLETK